MDEIRSRLNKAKEALSYAYAAYDAQQYSKCFSRLFQTVYNICFAYAYAKQGRTSGSYKIFHLVRVDLIRTHLIPEQLSDTLSDIQHFHFNHIVIEDLVDVDEEAQYQLSNVLLLYTSVSEYLFIHADSLLAHNN